MNVQKEDIQQLLNRYDDGETTRDEEQQLRHYFATTDIVPPEWRAYKALFAFVEESIDTIVTIGTIKHQRSRRWWLGAAASVAVLIGLAAAWPRPKNYAYLDGHRTTDAAVLMQEAEAALALVSTQEEDLFGMMNGENVDAL